MGLSAHSSSERTAAAAVAPRERWGTGGILSDDSDEGFTVG